MARKDIEVLNKYLVVLDMSDEAAEDFRYKYFRYLKEARQYAISQKSRYKLYKITYDRIGL